MTKVFSGIQPTSEIHIGNYFGAIKNYVALGEELGRNSIYCIVDYHAITIPHEASLLAQRSFNLALSLMACGLNTNKVSLFIQSAVPEHLELGWIFSTQTPLGDLERMTQFKDKTEQHSVLSGLLMYPVLQAADILIYKADTVPVGEDQAQHIELTREIARRFNYRFAPDKPIFPEPQARIEKTAARIPGLDGAGKMSKSKDNTIGVLEPFDSVWQKLRAAPTDPARVRRDDPGNPDVCLMFSYHKLFSPQETINTVNVECRRAGIGCVDCKKMLLSNIQNTLEPIHARAAELKTKPDEVRDALNDGASRCRTEARQTIGEVREAIGVYNSDSFGNNHD